jgi:hypothetical protein
LHEWIRGRVWKRKEVPTQFASTPHIGEPVSPAALSSPLLQQQGVVKKSCGHSEPTVCHPGGCA